MDVVLSILFSWITLTLENKDYIRLRLDPNGGLALFRGQFIQNRFF